MDTLVNHRSYPVPENEALRLSLLSSLNLTETTGDPELDTLVTLACELFRVPIALVSLLDEHQQRFKACKGLSVDSTEREAAFCNYTVTTGDLFVVEDTASDERFSMNPLVTGEPFIRFYAGAPVSFQPGVNLGTLCLIDTEPRKFTAREADQLRRMADIVAVLLRQYDNTHAVTRLATQLEEQNLQIHIHSTMLARQKSLFDRASALTNTGAWQWNHADDQLTWTNGMYDMHDLPRGSRITLEQARAFYSKEAQAELEALVARSMAEKTGYKFEGQITTARGRRRWVRLVADLEFEDGLVVRQYGVKQDITEQKAVWDQLHFLAERDALTTLPNRSTFNRELHSLCKGDACKPTALILIDVDGFKHVNDTFGHPVGDECLKQIANRLQQSCPEAVLVARLGGDEFALLMATVDPEVVGEYAERVLATVRRTVRWRGQSFQLSASVGIALAEGPRRDPSQLFSEADLALYNAKAAGRNTSRFFTADMKKLANERFEAVRNITKALNRKQLELFYQPKVDLNRGDELAGFEALLRWRRANGQVVAAGSFAAALEDPELSDRIGEWVICEALRQAREWHEAGLDFGHIAINLSSSQFRQPNFAHRLIAEIDHHGLQPDMIQVEVTEGVFLNQKSGQVREILKTLQEAGIRIALDDFGTGFASLTHLRTYPVDLLKIDRSFVQHFLTSFQDQAIVQATLFLARHLELNVVAEGIENVDQRDFLRALGCRYGQGFLFSRAVCASEAAEWCLSLSREAQALLDQGKPLRAAPPPS